MLRSSDGVTFWVAGMILVNRANKESRKAAKAKNTYALKPGASIIIFPEGTWNKSPNELVSGLFSGIYDVAKESGADADNYWDNYINNSMSEVKFYEYELEKHTK